jgi:hypothetical protein
MEKKNFISKEEVKNLVENGKYDNRGYYLVDIPNRFYNPNDYWKKIKEDAAVFQDFVEKVTEEVFHQNKVKGAEQKEDIIYLGYENRDRRLVLTFTSFNGFLEDTFNNVYNKRITYTFEVVIPDFVEDGGYFKIREWVKKMAKTIEKKYTSDGCLTNVDWEILSNKNAQIEVVQYSFE